ncbi:hypothetical protein P154DRAFT_391245, partial [Amniculicola lignicola CBS 123094]
AAALIFTPKELKFHLRYQRQQPSFTRHQLGVLPSACEFAAFLAWREKQVCSENDALAFGGVGIADELSAHLGVYMGKKAEKRASVARACGHALHPASSEADTLNCPVCVVRAHMAYMQRLTAVMEEAGDLDEQNPHRKAACTAWSAGKLSFVRVVYRMEQDVAQVMEWSAHHPAQDISGVKSIMEALQLYRGDDSVEGACRSGKQRNSRKIVTFSKDTEFGVGRESYLFHRIHPRYEPGKWQLSDEEDEECEEPGIEEENGEASENEESSDEEEGEPEEDDEENGELEDEASENEESSDEEESESEEDDEDVEEYECDYGEDT